jgi:hypothetical protein
MIAAMPFDVTFTSPGRLTSNSVGQCSDALHQPFSANRKINLASRSSRQDAHPLNRHFDTTSRAGLASGSGPEVLLTFVTLPSGAIVDTSSTIPSREAVRANHGYSRLTTRRKAISHCGGCDTAAGDERSSATSVHPIEASLFLGVLGISCYPRG